MPSPVEVARPELTELLVLLLLAPMLANVELYPPQPDGLQEQVQPQLQLHEQYDSIVSTPASNFLPSFLIISPP